MTWQSGALNVNTTLSSLFWLLNKSLLFSSSIVRVCFGQELGHARRTKEHIVVTRAQDEKSRNETQSPQGVKQESFLGSFKYNRTLFALKVYQIM